MTDPITDPLNNTGPPYPLSGRSGSNALGQWNVGVDPIGDIPVLSPWDVTISQYANGPVITQLLQSFFASLDQTANLQSFFDNIWNVDTASGQGLNIWGRIVGIGRTVQVPSAAPNVPYFGWNQAGQPGFSQGAPFWAGQAQPGPIINSYVLNDTQYRRLILAKALSNISNNSIPAINRCLFTLFYGRGRCWCSPNITALTYFGWNQAGAPGFNQGSPFYSGEASGFILGLVYNFTFPLTVTDYGMMNSKVMPVPPHLPTSIQFVSA